MISEIVALTSVIAAIVRLLAWEGATYTEKSIYKTFHPTSHEISIQNIAHDLLSKYYVPPVIFSLIIHQID